MIKLADEVIKKKITPKEMYDGQVGIIQNETDSTYEEYNGLIVMKIYNNQLVALNDVQTWENTNSLTFNIKILPNGTKIEITNNERE